VAFRSIVQAVTETKTLDTAKLIEYFEKGAQLDILKARKGTYRAWDHQLLQEMYTVTPKPKAQIKDKWDFHAARPGRTRTQRVARSAGADQRRKPPDTFAST